MSDDRTTPTTARDTSRGRTSLDDVWLNPIHAAAAELVADRLAAAFADAPSGVALADVATAAALTVAADELAQRGHVAAAALLDPESHPGRALDPRVSDDRVRRAYAERFGIVLVPVVGRAR